MPERRWGPRPARGRRSVPDERLRDISVSVREGTPEWPGDTPYSCRWTWQMAKGASVNVSAITMSPHVGTHADAPLHVHDGWPSSERLPLSAFVGRAVVHTLSGSGDLPSGNIERLLLRTGRSIADGSFPEDWPALSVAAVNDLLRRGLVLLGVDAPSVDARDSKALEVHHALFSGGAFNLENLDLRDAPDGEYDLVALPLRLSGVDAAPVRAMLLPVGRSSSG